MSEGFKKHFNASTMNGRANVAKVTYATMALLYIVYRIRRRSGKKSGAGGGMLADGSCSCDKERDPSAGGHDSDTGFYEIDPECGSCRERSERAMSEYDREQQRRSAAKARQDDQCRSEPPPPPPSSSPPASGGAAAPRRKCPCENPHRKVEGALKSSSNDTRAFMQRQQQEQQQQRAFKYQSPQEADEVRPASELVGQVHGAVYRVLSGVFNAVMGGGSAESSTATAASQTEKERQASGGACNCLDAAAAPLAADQADAQDDEEAVNAARYEAMDCECCCDSAPVVDEVQAQPEDGANFGCYNEGYASGMFFGQEDD
ncbi:uncharacterized protein LOC121405040 [Drosophila obscura]|uniref:uncharacterized protein LOC121405040 n=1 Tax=Drosophila obscura TaxID=7282 RepID=UPI001BB12152|nr:uncharacterized protein LOC121405040 [Drosophila obscura]